jgi:hypothetical protein
MTNLQKLLQATENQATVAKARERFAYKPYHERFAGLRTIALGGRALLPSLSIITGSFFLASVLSQLVPVWLALGLAGLLLVAWELAKAHLLTISFENHLGWRCWRWRSSSPSARA